MTAFQSRSATMLTAAVFSVILAAVAAQSFPPVDLPTTCAAVLCPVGTVCREEPKNGARCVNQVPAGPKPGECPSPDPFDIGFGQCDDSCSQDSDCDGDQKCCKKSCGALTCQQPRASCDTLKCDPGQKCEMQDVVCVRPPCDPQPVCVNVSKAGECPVPKPYTVGICAFTCSLDSDCDGDRKCCKNGCGGTNCQSPQSLIPTTPAPTRPTCATVRCSSGQTCVMKRPRDCIGVPCYPQPHCVDIDKPGECPKSSFFLYGFFACRSNAKFPIQTCRSDDYCPGDQKCCMTRCGKRCKDPVQTCATMKCEPGQKCEMQDVVCVRPPCDPQPVCVKVKPGECPKSSFFLYGFACRSNGKFPIQTCRSDDYCPGDQKCCMTRCGKRCQDPVQTCATVDCPPDHECVMKCNGRGCSPKPVCEPVKRCPVYPMWINPNCVREDLCSVKDPDACSPGTICCSTDCGRRCVRPVE